MTNPPHNLINNIIIIIIIMNTYSRCVQTDLQRSVFLQLESLLSLLKDSCETLTDPDGDHHKGEVLLEVHTHIHIKIT